MNHSLIVTIGVLLASLFSTGQIFINSGITAETAVTDVLLGSGVEPFNITFTGQPDQLGSFAEGDEAIGMESGLILSTGIVAGAIGPNSTTSHTSGEGNSGISDPDLNMITGTQTHDAAILEFDIAATGDSLLFDYIFASEEYNEYVCSSFNDAFGFFVSGPGISGQYSNNAMNIALVPNSDIEVSINTVNSGVSGPFGAGSICSASDPNWESNSNFFVDNDFNPSMATVQYDGFTVKLTASAAVQCGEVYHIKIAIADAFDYFLDSAVFLGANSLSSHDYGALASVSSYPQNGQTPVLVEGCIDGTIVVTRPEWNVQESIDLTWSGSAILGLDIESLPSSIEFNYYELEHVIPIITLSDDLSESTEDLTMSFSFVNSCGIETLVEVTHFIADYSAPTLDMPDTLFACPNEEVELAFEASGGMEPYSWMWPDESSEFTYSITPDQSEEVSVVLLDFCANSAEGLTFVELPQDLEVSSDSLICSDENGTLIIEGGLAPYSIESSIDLEWINETTFTTYSEDLITIEITDACDQSTSLDVEVVDCSLLIPNIFTPNADGSNDLLYIQGLESHPNSSLEVYNRWGTLVYAHPNYNNSWDGYGVNDGVYYLTLSLGNGENRQSELTIRR